MTNKNTRQILYEKSAGYRFDAVLYRSTLVRHTPEFYVKPRTCRGGAPPSCCARPFGRLKVPLGLSLLRCARKRELPLDVLGKGQAILPGVFQQELAELLLRNRRFQIILAPLGVGTVRSFVKMKLTNGIVAFPK